MKKKIVSILLAAAMVTSMLAGCGGTSDAGADADSGNDAASESGESGDAGEEAAESEADGESVVVKFQTWNPGEGDAINEIIDAFEAENPGITIDYVYMPYTEHVEKLKIDLQAGDAADVFGMQTGATYNEFRDFEMNLTGYMVEKYGEDWEADYNEYCMSLLNVDGSYYALPLGLTYAGFVWANMKIMNQYDLEVPTSLNDLIETCQVLRDNGEYPLTIGAKDAWINIDTWINIANDINSDKLYSALEGETSFEDADLVQSFEIWQSLFNNGVFQDGALGVSVYNDTDNMYGKEGILPMTLNGSWELGAYKEADAEAQAVYNAEDSDHEVFLIDWNNDGTVAPIAASVDVALCVNKNSEVADAALLFVDYMLHEGQDILINKYLSYCPSRTDLELNVEGLNEDGKANLDFVLEQADTNIAGYREMAYAELKQVITDELTRLALGETTPAESAATIEAASQTQAR